MLAGPGVIWLSSWEGDFEQAKESTQLNCIIL